LATDFAMSLDYVDRILLKAQFRSKTNNNNNNNKIIRPENNTVTVESFNYQRLQ